MDVKPHQTWKHTNGNEYTVLHVTNTAVVREGHEPDVVYQGSNGSVWSRPLADWHRSFTLVCDQAARGVVDEAAVERAAIAIHECKRDGTLLMHWGRYYADYQDKIRAQARAALQAAALPAVPSEFMGWVHEVVWVDGTSRDLRQKEPTMLDDSPGLISQRVVRVFADPLAATPAHDQPEGEG